MMASDVPAPEVLCTVNVDEAVVPPIASGLVTLVDAVAVVNAPVLAVVAPTVPLMLIDAVPVRLVTVPLAGVPSAVALPEASRLTDFSAGYETNTVDVPARVIAPPPMLEDNIVVRASVVPEVEYVPIPTSQAVPLVIV
jgi:hypothetical protein